MLNLNCVSSVSKLSVLRPYLLYLTTFIYSYFSSFKYFLPLSQQDIESGKINATSYIFDNIFHYPSLLLWIIKAKRENQRRRRKMESLYCCLPKKLLTIPYGVCDDQTEIHVIDLFADFYVWSILFLVFLVKPGHVAFLSNYIIQATVILFS